MERDDSSGPAPVRPAEPTGDPRIAAGAQPAPEPGVDEVTPASDAVDRRWPLVLGWLLAGTGTLVLLGFVLYQTGDTGILDFRIYLGAARAHANGGSLYDFVEPHYGLSATYPPIGPLLFVPWTWLDLHVAEAAWTLANLACLVLVAWLVGGDYLGLAGRRRTLFVLFGVALAVPTAPMWTSLNQGQINLWLWLAVIGDLVLVRRGRAAGGLLIGAATAVKLVPGIFIVFLVVIRRWRAVTVAALGAAACTLVGAALAPDDTRRYFTSLLWDTSRVGPLSDGQNNSLRAVLAHLGGPASLQVGLWIALVAVIVPVALWRASRAWRDGHDLYAVVVVGCAGALASPISWTHHLVFLLLALPLLPVPREASRWVRALIVGAGWLVLVDPVAFGNNRFTSTVHAVLMAVIACGGLLRPTSWLASGSAAGGGPPNGSRGAPRLASVA